MLTHRHIKQPAQSHLPNHNFLVKAHSKTQLVFIRLPLHGRHCSQGCTRINPLQPTVYVVASLIILLLQMMKLRAQRSLKKIFPRSASVLSVSGRAWHFTPPLH